jgi:RNA polymerase sigma-70 factor (ECF subfamily)
MATARPRLFRLARAHGLPLDTAHEVVQETLLEAWRHLNALSDPVGFQAWLNAICRNVCRRYRRAGYVLSQREAPLDLPGDPRAQNEEDGHDAPSPHDIPDPLAIDPLEEIERQDRETLLDRALGYLTPPTREAVMLCYLAELPQREAAQRLGVTISALEARLHRARRQLRQVLSGDLRAQAEAIGLTLDAADETTTALWRDTQLWCPSCARRRLRGAFEPLPAGRINLHLRCPGCAHEVNSWGHVPLQDMRSFRPAYKRVMRFTYSYFLPGLVSGQLVCEACGVLHPLRIVASDELLGAREPHRTDHDQERLPQSGVLAVSQCPACNRHQAEIAVAALLWTRPEVLRFLDAHPRSLTEPESLIEYRGQPAIRVRLTDITTAARLTLVTHPETLQVLATFQG